MKKEAKRGSMGSSVLDAPEDEYAQEMAWTQRGPAPTGALQRKYASDYDEPETFAGEGRSRTVRGRRESVRLRIPALPKSWWGRSLVGAGAFLTVGLASFAGYELRQYLLHDARYVLASSSDIQIGGIEHLSREQVLGVFGADVERNIFKISLADRRADLEKLPWVEHATVMRLLPNQIRVAVKERTPVAFVRQGTQIGLVDANGVLLDMTADSAGDPRYSFPVLTGLSADDPQSTRKARMDVYRGFMDALKAGGGKLSDELSEVDVTDPEDVKAIVAGNGSAVLVHFGDEDFLNRFQIFEQHLAEWRQTYPKLASADMRYQDQIVLDSGAAVTGNAAVNSAVATPGAVAPGDSVETHASEARHGTPGSAAAPKVVAARVVSPKPGARPVARRMAAARGNAAYQKMFAKLAAAHKAELAKRAAAKKQSGGGAGR